MFDNSRRLMKAVIEASYWGNPNVRRGACSTLTGNLLTEFFTQKYANFGIALEHYTWRSPRTFLRPVTLSASVKGSSAALPSPTPTSAQTSGSTMMTEK